MAFQAKHSPAPGKCRNVPNSIFSRVISCSVFSNSTPCITALCKSYCKWKVPTVNGGRGGWRWWKPLGNSVPFAPCVLWKILQNYKIHRKSLLLHSNMECPGHVYQTALAMIQVTLWSPEILGHGWHYRETLPPGRNLELEGGDMSVIGKMAGKYN